MKPETTMDKNSIPDVPVVVAQMASASEPRKRNMKKYLIIGGSIILVIAIILTAILVGMYLFTRAQTELLKYTLNMDKRTKQDVTVDQDDNSVEYHSYNDNYETWAVNDFNRDIQTVKVKTSTGTNCYVGPLNRTSAMDPSQIKTLPQNPSASNKTQTRTLYYDVSGTPVADSSFLGKKAKTMCSGISTYWLYPKCSGTGTDEVQRGKRRAVDCYWTSGWYDCGGGWSCRDFVCF